LEATVCNRGNVVERARVRVILSRNGRVLARLRSAARTFLPHSHAAVRFRYPARVRGRVTARLEAGTFRRSFRLRL
jgi:acyl-CoA thioesterase FadM